MSFEQLKSRIECVEGLSVSQHAGNLSCALNSKVNHNALSKNILCALESIFQYAAEQSSVKQLELHFLASDKNISCAGLHLREFAEHCAALQPGQDVLSSEYVFVRVMMALRALRGKLKTICVIEGHVMGAGLEVALSCDECVVTSDRALMMLPYMRIGLPYYRIGLERMVERLGFDVISRMILCEEEKFVAKEIIKNARALNKQDARDQAIVAFQRLEALWVQKYVEIGPYKCTIEDATGHLEDLLFYHMLLALKVQSAAQSSAIHAMIERYRLAACSQSFLAVVQGHAQTPSKKNQKFRAQMQFK